MCASYGLDPRFSNPEGLFAGDAELLDTLREWAVGNAGATLLPTGKNLRNVNPIVCESGGALSLDLGWWGYLVDGVPAKFASINTRSERLATRSGTPPATAVVPATSWFEMQQPGRQWFQYAGSGRASGGSAGTGGAPPLFALAAVTQPGRLLDGTAYTCYSLVMRPAPGRLSSVHARVPLLIPAGFMPDWLAGDALARDLIGAALEVSDHALEHIDAAAVAQRP